MKKTIKMKVRIEEEEREKVRDELRNKRKKRNWIIISTLQFYYSANFHEWCDLLILLFVMNGEWVQKIIMCPIAT